MKMTQESKNFIKHVKKECKKKDIKVVLLKKKYIMNGTAACSGYFSYSSNELVVAIGGKEEHWVGILAHEFAHFLQWKHDVKAWRDYENTYLIDAGTALELWLSKKIDLNLNQRQEYVNKVIAMELDCEKRAVKLIKEFALPVDIEKYIKKANAYLAGYQAFSALRKWSRPKKAPYTIDSIWTKMPSVFRYNYYKRLTPAQAEKKFGLCFVK